ncbi:NAD-dependent epimerase/dehydratase family protein [Elizabethkingia occulta]|uniref:NAD-dependent epimerase/dehydratase family protein n=1 Tax=Elizabethkingia occulta TaxID=1867263 RepID=UPI0009991918|nr:NAD-dependent epimerase/dehydratase family protein [Elizabethkingia occulta]OPB96527.1 NAD-dependent dehydratase [Elizabethkingia occulta]
MQTILGAGGDIGTPLAKELRRYTDKVRLVARNPKKVNQDDELFAANLLDEKNVIQALENTDVAYLTVGLPYNYKIWEKQWPVIIQNVIKACLTHGTKLVFLDNVYAYSEKEIGNMREDSHINPPSKKGKIREQLIKKLHEAEKNNGLKLIIAKSADFYGPDAKNGILNLLVIDNFKKGKKAQWQSDTTKIHSFTYTIDAAKGLALLGNTASAYGQNWHLPTSTERLNGKQFIELVATELNTKPRYTLLSSFMLRLAGLFSKTIKELIEMQYQNDRDYFFNSGKFVQEFNFTPTTYKQGIKEILKNS